MLLGLTGIILSYLVCIPLGIKKALNHGYLFDFGSSLMIFIAYSIRDGHLVVYCWFYSVEEVFGHVPLED